MANTEKRLLTERKMWWKFWKRKNKYKLIMEKLDKISTTLYNLEESVAENDREPDDKEINIEIKILKAELHRKNQFIESLLLKMLEGNFGIKKEDSITTKLSPTMQEYLRKKNGDAVKPRLP